MEQGCGLRGARGDPELETSFFHGDVVGEGRVIEGYYRLKRVILMMRSPLACWNRVEEWIVGRLSCSIYTGRLAKPIQKLT